MHFLIDFLLYPDHFIIVILQKYILLSGLRNGFLLTEVQSLEFPNIFKIAVFNAISKSGVGPKKGFPSTKIYILVHTPHSNYSPTILWEGEDRREIPTSSFPQK